MTAVRWFSRPAGSGPGFRAKSSFRVRPSAWTVEPMAPLYSQSSGSRNAEDGTGSFCPPGSVQRRRRLEPPKCSKYSTLMSTSSPAVSSTSSEICSLSQSSTQWSMTSSSSTQSRKPLSPVMENVVAPVFSGTSLPVQRTLTSSACPVVDWSRASRLGKSMSGSKTVAFSSWKSKAPSAEWV